MDIRPRSSSPEPSRQAREVRGRPHASERRIVPVVEHTRRPVQDMQPSSRPTHKRSVAMSPAMVADRFPSLDEAKPKAIQVDHHQPVKPIEEHAKHLYTPKQTEEHQPKQRPDMPRQSRSKVLHREIVKTETKAYKPKYRRPLMPSLMMGMASLLFIVGVGVVIQSIRTDRKVKAQVSQLASSQTPNSEDGITEGLPSEEDPPSDISGYAVSGDLPRFLNIDKLDINARVRRLGVGANNILKAPSNIFDVGWYEGSAKPGENGTVVLDGHVSGPTKRGVFYSLGTLKEGDVMTVERGDGKVFKYTVTGSEVYDNDKVDMAKLMTTSVPGKPGLNVITCTGRFNVRTNQFEKRVVVFAVLDES